MTQPATRNQKRGLEGCVPSSILLALEQSKRSHRPLPVLKNEPRRSQAVKEPFSAKTAIGFSYEATFLESATSSHPSQGRRALATSPARSSGSRHHTYGSRRASPSRPCKQEKLSEPIRSIDAGRRQLAEKVQQSYAASERTQQKLEQRGFMEEAMQGIANVMSVDCSSVVEGRERAAGGGSAKSFRGRRIGGRELSPPRGRHSPDHRLGEPRDSIDMFLSSKSAMPAPEQQIVTDLSGELGDSMKRREASPSPAPGNPSLLGESAGILYGGQGHMFPEYSYVAGDMEGSLDERIGQYGGLIPTLYTMDKLDTSAFLAKRKTVTQPASRYSIKVHTKDSKVTGAGFRRQASSRAKEYSPSPPERPRLEASTAVALVEDPYTQRAAGGMHVPGRVHMDGALKYAVA